MRKSPISRYKKFFLLLYMLLSFFIFLSSCSQPSPLPIDENIMHLMEFKGYQECNIISLANYENLHEFYGVSEAEFSARISEIFQQHPSEVKSEKKVLEQGDLAKISYWIVEDGNIIFDVPNQVVKVGTINFDNIIESSLLGRYVGETYSLDYQSSSLPGTSLICYIKPLYIYSLSDFVPDDNSIKNTFGANSIEEFYTNVFSDMVAEKKQECWSQVQSYLITESNFQINEEVLIDAAANAVYQEKLYSSIYSTDFESYIYENYGMNKSQFYNSCFQNAASEVKLYLIVGAIAYREHMYMDSSIFETYCSTYGLNPTTISEEDSCYIHYYFFLDCLIDDLCKLSESRG